MCMHAGERIVSNLARIVVVFWIFVVLILSASYTASLSARLTTWRLKKSDDVSILIRSGDYVGCREGSFIFLYLKALGFDESKIKQYKYSEDFDDALSKGSKNGGIKAMFVTTPYTKLFLSRSKYCKKYMRVGTPDLSEGSAFVFPEGSPLVADISRAIIDLMDNGRISEIKGRWISDSCSEDGVQPSDYADQSTIKLESFKILFAVTGGITATCLVVYLASYLYKNRGFVQRISSSGATTRAKIRAMCKHFDQRDPKSFRVSRRGNGDGDQTVPPSPNVYQDRWSSIVPISTDETPVEIRVVCPNSDNSNVAADENL
ncbi:hypothetical protein ACS0TY_035534 [Phlomoides rotata]